MFDVWVHAPPENLKLKFSEMLLFTFPWRYFLSKRSILGKVNATRTIRITETFFNFYSIVLATENVHHTLTPCALSSYSFNCPETLTHKVSHVPKNMSVSPKLLFTSYTHVISQRVYSSEIKVGFWAGG